MAMYRNSAFILNNGCIENVHHSHHMFKCSGCHVLPTFVEEFYPLIEECFWIIAETHHGKVSIPAVRVLNKQNTTSPGYCKFRIVLILCWWNLSNRLNSLINLSLGLCMAKISDVIQFECSPSIALGCTLFVL